MFPAWWLLGVQDNEPPVDEPDEAVCWPMTGSGEIDIFDPHNWVKHEVWQYIRKT